VKKNIARNDVRIDRYLTLKSDDIKGLYFSGQDIMGGKIN